MSIAINDNITRNLYTAAAGQTVFTVNFPFVDETYLAVYQRDSAAEPSNGSDQKLDLGVDYSVSGAGNEAGGTITLNVGASSGDIIAIVGVEPVDRLTTFQDLNPLTVSLNQQLNELTIMVKQNQTIMDNLTPRYRYDELLSYEVRQDNLNLPILNDGDFWVGRGNFGDNPDDIYTRNISEFTGGGGGGGGGEGDVETTITQDTSDLFEGAWLKFTPGTNLYEKAQADNATNGDVVGLCKSIASPNSFVMQQVGRNNSTFTGLTTGNWFLSATTAGEMSLSPPLNDDEVSVPVFAADSATTGWVRNFRGKILGDDGSGSDTGDGDNQVIVTQVGHDFMLGEALYIDAAGHYDRAIATSFETAQVAGIVVELPADTDTFVLQQAGWSTKLTVATAAALYWLSDTVAGLITETKPTDSTSFLRQVYNSYSTSSGWILEQVQLEKPSTNIEVITQVGHTFAVGKFVRPSTSTDGEWALAQADSVVNATGVWMVIKVVGDDFWIQQDGLTDKISVLGGSATGDIAYLSSTAAGDATLTEPTATGEATLPLYRLTDNSTTPRTGELLNVRPLQLPFGGAGDGGWNLLETQAVSAVTNIDFATVISDNPQYTSYELRFYDVYGNTFQQNLLLQYYVGGVLQTTGYQSQARQSLSGVSNITSSTNVLLYGVNEYLRQTLLEAASGSLEMWAPRTNGTQKKADGVYSMGQTNVNVLQERIIASSRFTGSTAPIEGVYIHSGGVHLITGTFKIYGRA